MNFLHLKNGLREIVNNYEIFSIDLWGVVHNGVSLNSSAIDVLDNLKKNNKKFILMTNAPRTRQNVAIFLDKLNFNKEYFQNIFTSGDAALNSLRLDSHGKSFFHLGPERDQNLFFEPLPGKDYLIGTHSRNGMYVINKNNDTHREKRDITVYELYELLRNYLGLDGNRTN